VVGRFFQRLQECVGRSDGQAIGVVDHTDLAVCGQRPIHDLLFDFPDLLDLDLWSRQLAVRLDKEVIGMSAHADVVTGAALTAGIQFHVR